MKEINIDFLERLDGDKVEIQEIINIEIKCKSKNYYEINKSLDKNKIGVYMNLVFQIEYIEKNTSKLKYIEIIKHISDFIILDSQISLDMKYKESINIIDKGYVLLDKNNISVNAIISI